MSEHEALTGQRLDAYSSCFGTDFILHPGTAAEDPVVDVLAYPPGPGGRPFFTLVTNGMSDRRQFPPAAVLSGAPGRSPRCELVWYVRQPRKEFILHLAWLGRFPFIDRTWLSEGHTLEGFQPIVDGSVLKHTLLTQTIVTADARIGDALKIGGDPVPLYWVHLLSDGEFLLKKTSGLDAVLDLFESAGHPTEFLEDRPSYVK